MKIQGTAWLKDFELNWLTHPLTFCLVPSRMLPYSLIENINLSCDFGDLLTKPGFNFFPFLSIWSSINGWKSEPYKALLQVIILLQCEAVFFGVPLTINVTTASLFSAKITTFPDNVDLFVFGFGKGSRKISFYGEDLT